VVYRSGSSITPSEKRIVSSLRKESIKRMVLTGVREDGRGLDQMRNIEARARVIDTADGSALVSLGNTKIVAGVKMGLGAPFPDSPDEGILIVNAEVLPHASPYSEPGPPDEYAIELARVVDRALRHSGWIDLKSLVVEPGRVARILWCDIYVLNDDGNLVDAAGIAAVVAIRTAEFPTVVKADSGYQLDRSKREPLKLNDERMPFIISFGKIMNKLIVDPSSDEEDILDGRISIAYAGDRIVAIQKTVGQFTAQEILEAVRRAKELRDKLYESLRHIFTSVKV